ncbi:MAG: AIG2-like domain protein, partial [uncultured Nocardioides sp.]
DALRRLRDEHGPRTHERAVPALAAEDHRLAHRLAPDLRRRGARLGRRPAHHRRGPDRAGLRRGVRRHPRGRVGPRRLGERRHRALPQDQGARLDDERRGAGVGLRARRLRGRAAVGVPARHAGLRGGGGRRAGRLRRGAAASYLPLDRPL